MICYPNAKINIGLNILGKRNDGFHDLETIFYPVKIKDALEEYEKILPQRKEATGKKMKIIDFCGALGA